MTLRLDLFSDPAPAPSDPEFPDGWAPPAPLSGVVVVAVDETVLHATRGMEWWLAFRVGQPGRCRCVDATIGGCLYEVAVTDRDHALGLIESMVGQGLPRRAFSIRRPAPTIKESLIVAPTRGTALLAEIKHEATGSYAWYKLAIELREHKRDLTGTEREEYAAIMRRFDRGVGVG